MDFNFSQLSDLVQRALKDMGFERPTPIQKEAIPLALKGYDIMGQAATGTGKTAAFGIPIVEGSKKEEGTTALIMTPTRELALQVKEQLQQLSKYKGLKVFSFYGGTPVQKDLELLWKITPNIVVISPCKETTLKPLLFSSSAISLASFFVFTKTMTFSRRCSLSIFSSSESFCLEELSFISLSSIFGCSFFISEEFKKLSASKTALSRLSRGA